jgi:predicted RNase H-like nuclease
LFESYKNANDRYWSSDDKGISKQLWGIRDKLKEVNEVMTPERQSRLMETHPELVFWRLNGRKYLENKKTDAGRTQRIELLERHGFNKIGKWLGLRYGTGIRRDDLIDACACALAARNSKERFPNGDPQKARGIRMEIWY